MGLEILKPTRRAECAKRDTIELVESRLAREAGGLGIVPAEASAGQRHTPKPLLQHAACIELILNKILSDCSPGALYITI